MWIVDVSENVGERRRRRRSEKSVAGVMELNDLPFEMRPVPAFAAKGVIGKQNELDLRESADCEHEVGPNESIASTSIALRESDILSFTHLHQPLLHPFCQVCHAIWQISEVRLLRPRSDACNPVSNGHNVSYHESQYHAAKYSSPSLRSPRPARPSFRATSSSPPWDHTPRGARCCCYKT